MSLWFFNYNTWARNCTFIANIFGLPLYDVVLPNQHGMGFLVWFMMCTNNRSIDQESSALELTIRIITSRIVSIQPEVVVINKVQQELNTILKANQSIFALWD